MKRILLHCLLLLAGSLTQYSFAQKKLLILGSSTPACFNISSDSCYVGRLQRYYQQSGQSVVIDNRAVAGDNCYHGMPAGYTPPAGRNGARPYNNITDGLQGNPDIVLVNYPSNGYDEFSIDEVMFCLRTIRQTANNAGKPCYIATTQPRSQPASFQTPAVRQKMQLLKESILNEFGQYALNFWDDLVNPADNSLQSIYDSGDGTHLTAAGHRVLFNKVVQKNFFGTQPGNLSYRYYEGNWNTLPDFNALTPVKTGTAANISLDPRNANDYFGFVWEGTINIPAAGTYTFETISDDGSKFYFNSLYNNSATALVNNDGAHWPVSVSGSVYVPAAGAYPVAITYFEKTAGETMQLYWSGPGIGRQLVPDAAFSSAPAATSGLSYRYYEGSWNALPDFNALTPVKTGNSGNVDISRRTPGVYDYFGFVWEGQITIPTAGTYTFETISDDGSKVYFNSVYNAAATPVVDNDGLHAPVSVSGSVYIPSAGTYPIAITYFEKNGGEHMQVYWSGPGISRQMIPDAAFSQTIAPPASQAGLTYKYYTGEFSALPDFNALTSLKTGTSANLDLAVRPSGVNDRFALFWTGSVNLPAAGTYTFETISDDGSKVYINTPYAYTATATVNNDGLHGPYSASGTVTVPAAGRYPITVTFFERDGGETLQLFWSGPGISRQPVPDAAFTTTSGTQGVANSQAAATATLPELPGSAPVRLYPNPFSQSFTIEYFASGIQQQASVDLYNAAGKQVDHYQPARLAAGRNTWTIKPTGKTLGAGVYIAQIKVDGVVVKTVKLIKTDLSPVVR